jgi:hypothetical protein
MLGGWFDADDIELATGCKIVATLFVVGTRPADMAVPLDRSREPYPARTRTGKWHSSATEILYHRKKTLSDLEGQRRPKNARTARTITTKPTI